MFAIGGAVGSCMAQMAGAAACSACSCATRELMNQSARLGFSLLFFLSMIISWALRDFAKPLIERIPCARARRRPAAAPRAGRPQGLALPLAAPPAPAAQ